MILSAAVHDDRRETEEDRSHSGRDRVDSFMVGRVYMCSSDVRSFSTE